MYCHAALIKGMGSRKNVARCPEDRQSPASSISKTTTTKVYGR